MVFCWKIVVVVGPSLKALEVPPVCTMMSWGDTEHPENLPGNADRFKLGLIKPGTKFNQNFFPLENIPRCIQPQPP